MDFEAIPGVGAKTAAALAELEDAERALADGDVARIATAPGISPTRAARIARATIRHRHDDPGGFLATDRAREIYRAILDRLADRAVTEAGASRLETIYPSRVQSRIDEVRAFATRAMEHEPDSAVLEHLADVSPMDPSPDIVVRDRCLATTDAERYTAARDAFPELSVEVVEDARGLAELARGYSTVIALDEAFAGVDVDGDIRVVPDALDRAAEIVPERILGFYAVNRARLHAAIRVHREAGLTPPDDLPIGLDALEDAIERLDDDGGVMGDDELTRLDRAVDQLDSALDDAEHQANEQLRAAIRERDVTIEGTDLLSLVERGAGVDSLLRRELANEYDVAVDTARDSLVSALALVDDEVDYATRCFPDEPTYPVEREGAAVTRLRDALTRARDQRAATEKRELAATLADARAGATALVRRAIELDAEYAIARFADDFDCVMPAIGGTGMEIEGGRSPLLDVPFESVEPVDYTVSGVTLLSGVNSGGKTSVLDLLAFCTILAHMGLPVPADRASVARFDALYYQAKTQGTLDAGAFEATLRQFHDIAGGNGRRLVLVDELESITEPGASARIVAGILEALAEENATAVFVSHLAGEIRDAATIEVTVDGIEALGLENGELRVNRSPVPDHLARSTPELIVESLAAEDAGGFYDRLLEKFE